MLPLSAVWAGSLDQDHIHRIYNEGDFDRVIVSIDSFTRENKTYGLIDSIFIAKHLSVVYTANPATREKGKGYMFRLLDLMPSAKIVDMFVSDEIDRIFEKVREEAVIRNRVLGRKGPEAPDGSGSAAAGKKSSKATLYWIAGGAALAAAVGTTYLVLNTDTPEDKVYGFPSE